MKDKPKIILSARDVERLEALIDKLPDTDDPHADALLHEIRRAEIVDPRDVPPDVVTMNSQVRFLIESPNLELSLTLVYPTEVDGSGHSISILAPVGSALLGLKVGDSIEWPGPGGQTIKVRVIDLLYQPERSGDYHL